MCVIIKNTTDGCHNKQKKRKISKLKSALADFKENITYINNTVAMFILESISEDVSINVITSVISDVTPMLNTSMYITNPC